MASPSPAGVRSEDQRAHRWAVEERQEIPRLHGETQTRRVEACAPFDHQRARLNAPGWSRSPRARPNRLPRCRLIPRKGLPGDTKPADWAGFIEFLLHTGLRISEAV